MMVTASRLHKEGGARWANPGVEQIGMVSTPLAGSSCYATLGCL